MEKITVHSPNNFHQIEGSQDENNSSFEEPQIITGPIKIADIPEEEEATDVHQVGNNYQAIPAPMPLLPKGAYKIDEASPMWANRKVGTTRFNLENDSKDDEPDTDFINQQTQAASKLFQDAQVSSKIPIKYGGYSLDQISQFEKWPVPVYECYKPTNLKESRDYINFMLKQRSIYPSSYFRSEMDQDFPSTQPKQSQEQRQEELRQKSLVLDSTVPERIQGYFNQKVQYSLPSGIDQSKLLMFDSNFECGNLDLVFFQTQYEYNLYLKNDSNTKGHQLWFYFAVTNVKKDTDYTFNIMNTTRFKDGFKPFLFSEIHYEQTGKQWTSDWVVDFKSRKNMLKKQLMQTDEEAEPTTRRRKKRVVRPYYTMTIKFNCKYDGDRIYLALSLPYSCTKLKQFMTKCKEKLSLAATKLTLLKDDEGEGKGKSAEGEVKDADTRFVQKYKSKIGSKNEAVIGKKHLILKQQAIMCLKNLINETEQTLLKDKVVLDQMREEKEAMNDQQPLPDSIIEDLEQGKISIGDLDECIIHTKQLYFKSEILCQSLSGHPVHVFTITGCKSSTTPFHKRKFIVITARVHPGETTASYKMQGIIQFLLFNHHKQSQYLRDKYIFKIVPMLNPDGVLMGNFRTSLAGVDLNRRWQQPNYILHPQIHALKQMLASFDREIIVFCDLHGHSKKKNAFIYGCNTAANGGFCSWTKVRILPRIFAALNPVFNYQDCKFRVEKDKLGTARVVVWNEFGVTNSFTLETSLYGTDSNGVAEAFDSTALKSIGQYFCLTLIQFSHVLKEIEKEMKVTNGWLKPSKFKELTGKPAIENLSFKSQKPQRKVSDDTSKPHKNLNTQILSLDNTSKGTSKREPQTSTMRKKIKGKEDSKKYFPRGVFRSPKTTKLKVKRESDSQILAKQLQEGFSALAIRNSSTHFQKDKKHSPLAKTQGLIGNSPVSSDRAPKLVNKRIPVKMNTSKHIRKQVSKKVKGGDATTSSKVSKVTIESKNDTIGIDRIESQDGSDQDQDSGSGSPVIRGDSFGVDNTDYFEEISLIGGITKVVVNKHHWRDLFKQEEIISAYEQIANGEDPNELEVIDSVGSDSCPSEDNYEDNEIDNQILSAIHVMRPNFDLGTQPSYGGDRESPVLKTNRSVSETEQADETPVYIEPFEEVKQVKKKKPIVKRGNSKVKHGFGSPPSAMLNSVYLDSAKKQQKK